MKAKFEIARDTKMSDEEYNAWMRHRELERRLAAAKSNILKSRRSKPGAGDIKDTSNTEVERLRALKTKIEAEMAGLEAKFPSLKGKEAETPEIENPTEEPHKFHYPFGIFDFTDKPRGPMEWFLAKADNPEIDNSNFAEFYQRHY
jgi:hypothetical protein